MRTVRIVFGLSTLIGLEACHGHHHTGVVLPPVPERPAERAFVPSEPAAPAEKDAAGSVERVADSYSHEPDTAVTPPVGDLLLQLADAFFDLDQHALRIDAKRALEVDASLLKQILSANPLITMLIEGHCDERGSAEYNLALGARRAEAAKEFLTGLGIPSVVLRTVSYGKERPECTGQTEACWQKNRRAHLTPVP